MILNQLLNQLKEHFSSMTHEEKVKEWAEYDKYNSVGPTVNEFLNEGLSINNMMENRELLLKDICARLPYEVKAQIPDEYGGYTSVIGNVDIDGYVSDSEGNIFEVDIVKPYLFPLSSMTEEQMKELEELLDMYTPDDDYHPYAYKGIKVLYKHVLDDNYEFNFNTDTIEWLLKNHFDIRGLIPMGLANDATGKNIY